ncbi:hypothetical protein [Streptomyces sp. NPDC002467]|uniref:hypothetical protein n=1 Tax=Streptomyces sp. NPDC002467 TaxID=3364647 RepID=UPI0036A5ACAC
MGAGPVAFMDVRVLLPLLAAAGLAVATLLLVSRRPQAGGCDLRIGAPPRIPRLKRRRG